MKKEGSSQGLAHFHLGVGAGRAAKAYKSSGRVHLLGQKRVVTATGCRPVSEMDGLAPCERCVDLVGQEWAEGCKHLRNGGEALVERGVSGSITGLPEAGPTATHVPVRQIVDEFRDSTGTAEGIKTLKGRGDGGHGVVEFREDPAIKDMRGRSCLRVGLPSVEVGIGGKERKHIPECEQRLACGFADAVRENAPWCPWLSR
ncbi:unannotated protein [freshwater metagenome]|uniref:Unannotated protein n=1 Tax=freshwater metagenome TaxID=449393 RepID=A0A6J6FVN9_9ZZZZ